MRTFNYIKNYDLMSTTIKGYIKQLEKETKLLSTIENNPIYNQANTIINEFIEKYPDLSIIARKISNDLMQPECINSYYQNGKYPDDASNIGTIFEKDIRKILALEDALRDEAVKSWKTEMTPFEDIVNGEEFMIVGHAALACPGTIDSRKYNPHNSQYISCSLFSDKEFNTFMGYKTVYLFDINDDNYISSSYTDSVTSEMPEQDFLTLKKLNINDEERYIKVGFSNDSESSVTTISTPKLIEQLSVAREKEQNNEILKYDHTHTNEVVLDRTTTRIKGAVLMGNGCDLMLNEYLQLQQESIEFKCLNKGLYREKNGLSSYTEEEYEEFSKKLSRLDEYIKQNELSSEQLQGYYDEVVTPMNYSPEIKEIIDNKFSQYIDIGKQK